MGCGILKGRKRDSRRSFLRGKGNPVPVSKLTLRARHRAPNRPGLRPWTSSKSNPAREAGVSCTGRARPLPPPRRVPDMSERIDADRELAPHAQTLVRLPGGTRESPRSQTVQRTSNRQGPAAPLPDQGDRPVAGPGPCWPIPDHRHRPSRRPPATVPPPLDILPARSTARWTTAGPCLPLR